MDHHLPFADLALPTGLDIEIVSLHQPLGRVADVGQARRAVQLCSVGLGDLPVHRDGVETPATTLVAALDLDVFVERRIHGWAGLN
jgi:hypothetical protein